jgi:hypothetical protein
MDFQNTPEQEAFRQELRGWLAANLPRELCVDDPTDERVAPDRPTFEKRVAWQRIMCKAGWVGISWPREFGGRGATLMEQLIYDEECFRARAPVLPGYSGIGMIGPTLIEVGTHAQKARFVPRILTAEDIWCQGFSEPGAGSDLAGAADARGGQGRPLPRQRAEGVDLGRPVRGLDLSPGAHGSRRAQAQGHQLSPRGHEDARHHRAPARAHERPPALQRGLLRGRGGAEGKPGGQGQPGLGRRHDHPHVRAQGGRRARPRRSGAAAGRARARAEP